MSIHQRVINLVSGDELLALALPQVGGSSRFLSLNALPRLSVGENLQLSCDALTLGSEYVELAGTPLWQGPLPVDFHTTAAPDCLERFEKAARTLNIRPGAYADCDITPQTVARWIGLGPGLTPAGDDVLLGYIAVANHLGQNTAWTRALHESVNSGLEQTTTLSAYLLRSAVQGDYHEFVQRVLAVLCGLSSENLTTALRRLGAVGATSGESIIYGMWMSLVHIMAPDGADIYEESWPLSVARCNGGELCIA